MLLLLLVSTVAAAVAWFHLDDLAGPGRGRRQGEVVLRDHRPSRLRSSSSRSLARQVRRRSRRSRAVGRIRAIGGRGRGAGAGPVDRGILIRRWRQVEGRRGIGRAVFAPDVA